MEDVKTYIEQNKDRILNELFELLRIPSVSADPVHAQDVWEAAKKVKELLEKAGLDNVSLEETPGYPIVYGEKIIDPSLPTVLVYGHYDVQPADPLDQWHSDPFEPVIRQTEEHPEGAIFARGASDDKGQMFMHIKALEYMIKNNKLPANVKVMIEGEEEVGSESLAWYVKNNKDKLKNDIILISDTALISKDVPSITTGLRGLAAVEVTVKGPSHDLHSGLYGGTVANPANMLARLIASMHDEDGKITIPGFYDKVVEFSPELRELINSIPFDEEKYKASIGVDELWGEKDYTPVERTSIRPTLDVNGIWGGYTGEGTKTIIPSEASAKITMRLVPDQEPDEIARLFKAYVEQHTPPGTKVEVKTYHGGYPYLMPVDHPGYKAAEKALETTFGKKVYPFFTGGSIPIVPLFEKELGTKSVLMGFGLDSDRIHSPNENLGLWNFFKGIETIPYFYQYFTQDYGA
ncbi:MAG: dipeptidase [Chlorobi bacterium]|nr:dipeptidase [Chlorobiota bacterium]